MGFGLAAVGMIGVWLSSYVAIVISHIPVALTKGTACDKLSPAQLGMAAGSAVATPALITVLFWKEWSVYA